jgi:hypothetical protein
MAQGGVAEMADVNALIDRLDKTPDTIDDLEQAACNRYDEGEGLRKQNHLLAALYLYGYSVEMCLAAAYFRRFGFARGDTIEPKHRKRHMEQAQQTVDGAGEPLMAPGAQPLPGWARLLEWQRRRQPSKPLGPEEERLFSEAVVKARMVYRHWRPRLRYTSLVVTLEQIEEVRRCVSWFIDHRFELTGE